MTLAQERTNLVDTLPVPVERLRLREFGMTDRGKVRSRNEDHFLVADLTKTLHVQQTSLFQPKTRFSEQQAHLFLVADGLGGHQAGEQASALTVDAVEEFALNNIPWFFQLEGTDRHKVLDEFQTALHQTNERLCDLAERRPELHGMGTTLTLAYLLDTKLLVMHVGDSRCYLLRHGKLFQLTQDHTVAAEMVRRGVLEPEQARQHKYRKVVTNVMGGSQIAVDVETQSVDVQPADVLMLCTDGLTEMVPIQTVFDVLQSVEDPSSACKQLVALANKNGGKDNITIIVVRCDG